MPNVPKPVPMAECLNFGIDHLDLIPPANNDELRQAMMQQRPAMEAMFHDVMLKYMNFNLPSQNEKNEVVMSVNPKNAKISSSNRSNDMTNSFNECEDKFAECSLDDYDSGDESKTDGDYTKKPEVPCVDSALYFLPVNYNKRNPWRRTIGLHVNGNVSHGNELRSATYPARSSVKKLRFAQAKKPFNYLYSYFSVEVLDCDDTSSITVGICRKDYPSKISPGKNSGSVGYNSDTGVISIRDSILLDGPRFSKGDVIGCGIIYPAHYKPYAELSTDDNSDGMSDVVIASIGNTNTKSVDFVCSVLNLNNPKQEFNEDIETAATKCLTDYKTEEYDYYNENFVESRTQVEVYFTHNMKVVGKVLSYVPVGGFYPTVHMFSCSAIRMNVDLNPPFS